MTAPGNHMYVPDHKVTREDAFPVEDMVVYEEVQRDLSDAHVDRIARDWNIGLCDALHLVKRADGTYSLVDGQHRREAAMRKGITHLPVIIHEGVNEEQEAAIHLHLQALRKIDNPATKWKLTAQAGSESHRLTDALLEKIDLTVGRSAGVTTIPATLAEWLTEEAGSEMLVEALTCAEGIYGKTKDAHETYFVAGLALLLNNHPTVATRDELADRLSSVLNKKGLGYKQLLGQVNQTLANSPQGSGRRTSRAKTMASILAGEWNHGKRAKASMYPVDAITHEFLTEDDDES